MSKKEKIGIGCLIGVLLVVFAVALALDVMPKVRLRIAMHSPRDITKVRMVFKRGTLTPKGATIIVDDSNDYHFSYYPDHYSLQKRENDEWKEAKHVEYEGRYNPAFIRHEIYCLPSEENPIEMELNWKGRYGELTEGMYRLVIEIEDENDGYKKYEKYLYFQVKEITIYNTETQSERIEYLAIEQDKKEAEETEEEKEKRKKSLYEGNSKYNLESIRPSY